MAKKIKTLNDINGATEEGKLLIAALSILTTTKEVNFMGDVVHGTQTTPDEMLGKLQSLAETY